MVEHFINSTPDVDAPIAENSKVDDNSTIVPYSSPVVQCSHCSLEINRCRRPHVRPKRLINECNNVAYALSCVEGIEGSAKPSNYSEPISSVD
jgi:hypothetical protein